MANNIKGLIVEIGGDTTQLGKALESVNKRSSDLSSELGNINKLLRFDPGNADLLTQKQKVLADAVSNTSEKLDKLKEAERQVQEQFKRGEASEAQVRELQREIIATTNKLDGYKRAAKEADDAIENLGNSSKRTTQETADLKAKVADLATSGLKGLAGMATVAVTALTAAAESTREYRTEMGKLNTAFTDNGFSAEAARSAYTELQGVLGETDQSVEAANHLAKLTDNEQDLATWTGDILPGVFATFGDSLPIEGLTEAANETAKVGQVTGPLADALNWAGISEDAFNESLAACTSEQERQKLIMDTLAGTYGAASAAYKETNADVIAANKVNEEWNASLAQVGAAVEPVLTNVKSLGAELLANLVPVIQRLLANLPTIAVALAGVTAAVTAFKIASIAAKAATEGMTLAQYAAAAAQRALNVAMSANPIGLIILAITGLVAAFMYLWQNSEGFREFWTGLWEKISGAVSAAVDFIKTLPDRIGTILTSALTRVANWHINIVAKAREVGISFLSTVVSFFTQLPEKIWGFLSSAVSRVVTWQMNMIREAKETGANFLSKIASFFAQLPEKIWGFLTSAINLVMTWRLNMIQQAIEAASSFLSNVANFFSQLPGKIWSYLSQALDKVASWATKLAQKGKAAAKSLVTAVTDGVKGLPSTLFNIGSDLVEGLWNGINGKVSWLKGKVTSFANSIMDTIKSAFGVSSPSKETEWVGDMLDQGLTRGVIKNANDPVRAMQRVSGQVLDAASGEMDGMTMGYRLAGSAGVDTAAASNAGLADKLDAILKAIERGQILTIDGSAFVGATADRYDATLGQKRALAARGAV